MGFLKNGEGGENDGRLLIDLIVDTTDKSNQPYFSESWLNLLFSLFRKMVVEKGLLNEVQSKITKLPNYNSYSEN